MLGHRDIRTTQIYAPTVSDKHLAAVERLHAADQRQYDQESLLALLAAPAASQERSGECMARTRGTHRGRSSGQNKCSAVRQLATARP